MTLTDVAIDVGEGAFAEGQTYVALSRARSLSDVSLLAPIRDGDIQVSSAVKRFLHEMRSAGRIS